MKNTILTLFLLLSTAAAANPYLKQGTHIRILLSDGWSGSYIESTYVRDLGTVRFDFCRRDPANTHFKKCHRLHRPTILIRNLSFYQDFLLTDLRELRTKLAAELDENFFSRLVGGSKGDKNVLALDTIIAEIEHDSLENWLLLREKISPAVGVSNHKTAKKVAQIFQRVLELTPPQAPTPGPPGVLLGSGI